MSASTIERVKETLAERARALQAGFTLWYAGEEAFEFMSNGHIFTIPAKGTLVVKDIYGHKTSGTTMEERAQTRKIVTAGLRGHPRNKGNHLIMSAMSVIEFAVNKFADRGVCLLIGVEKDDNDAKAEALTRWTAWRTTTAEQTIQAYERRTESFYRDSRHAGQMAPPMGDHERKAQEFLDDLKIAGKGRRAFLCPANCGYDSDTAEQINKHVAAKHPMLVDQLEAVPTPRADSGGGKKRG